MTLSFVALGSNLDNPRRQVAAALEELAELPGTQCLASSAWYRSKAAGPGSQPDYINAVAALETSRSALQLLRLLQGIEDRHGRRRLQRWGARTLDLDILLYGSEAIDHPDLQAPHPRMHQRAFVLQPLFDLAPDLSLPCGATVAALLARCPRQGLHKVAGTDAPMAGVQ